MKKSVMQIFPAKKTQGFILLVLLIVIVIGVVFSYFVLNPQVDRKTAQMQKQSPEKYPWVEENSLVEAEKVVEKPSTEQIEIMETVGLLSEVSENNESRGSIHLLINTDGRIEGTWGGDYETAKPRMNYMVVICRFKGNIVPGKIYTNENIEDVSKLYFITKGRFGVLETNYESGKVRTVEGIIYVTGWIAKDYSIKGEIHLTNDKINQFIFEWNGNLVKTPQMLNFKEQKFPGILN